MNLRLSFNQAVDRWSDKIAIVDGDRRFTYGEFGRRVLSLLAALDSKGIRQGQVIAIVAPNVHEYLEIYYACAISGIVLNPINFRLSATEIALILEDSQAKLLFCHGDFQTQIQTAVTTSRIKEVIWLRNSRPAELNIASDDYESSLQTKPAQIPNYDLPPESLAQLYYTSGTTGKPKGVMLTQGNVTTHAMAAIDELNLSATDTWAHIAPMFHLADAWASFAITSAGGKHVFVPYFEPVQVLQAIEAERVTISNLIPTMLSALINHQDISKHDFSSLRCLLSGGAPIAPDTVRKIISAFGCDYVQTYGMTETSPYLTLSLLKDHLKDLPEARQLEYKSRTGRAFATVELKVVRADGSEIEDNDREVGEIIVKGPTVTSGYWNQPQATADAIKEGWLHTGDLATIDKEGYVNIVDRKKDMIVTGGENVYSTEVEHVLYEHPGVLECAVFGIPDDTWGEAVKAAVVVKPGSVVIEQELIDFVKGRLAHYKSPKSVDFIAALPKTGSGKICKKDLKEPYWQGYKSRVH